MKKITLSILAAGLAAMTLASCGGDAVDTTAGSGNTTATPAVSVPTTKTPESTTPATTATTPASEVTTEPTAAPSTPAETSAEATTATTEPTAAPSTPKTNGGETIENLYYAIDVDITIVDGNAGIVFAGANSSNFVMWQLAIGEHNDGNLWLSNSEGISNFSLKQRKVVRKLPPSRLGTREFKRGAAYIDSAGRI